MSESADKKELSATSAETPARSRRAASQRVREARDRLTSTSGTRPAFDHELLRQYAQTRISASLVVILLVVSTGILASFWIPAVAAVIWTAGILAIHGIVIRFCSKFLAITSSSPAITRKWRMRFVGLDLLYGLAWTLVLIHPSRHRCRLKHADAVRHAAGHCRIEHAGGKPADCGFCGDRRYQRQSQ